MGSPFQVFGIKTKILVPGDDISRIIVDNAKVTEGLEGGIADGDIVVLAESALATAEGGIVTLSEITPSKKALEYGEKYRIDARLAEVVISESDRVVGGIPGFLLCLKNGTLLPNAGIDASNAPAGKVVKLPKDPDASAERVRKEIRQLTGRNIGVLVIDSRTHAMRLGCSGIAIGCSGMDAITDERGKRDLYGHELEVTRRAIGDDIASAAELVLGESNECTPVAVVRGLSQFLSDNRGIESIEPSECLFMGTAMNADSSLFNRE